MRISIYKNKHLFINAVITFLSIFCFFTFLIMPKQNWDGWGEYPYKLSFLREIIDNFDEFINYCNCDNKYFHIFVDTFSIVLMILSVVIFIYQFFIILKQDRKIRYNIYLLSQIIYLFIILYIYIIDLYLFIPHITMYKYLSTIMLIPIICYEIYNIIYTTIIKKRSLLNETE